MKITNEFYISIGELQTKYGLNFDGMSDDEIKEKCDEWYKEYINHKSKGLKNRKERRLNKAKK
jgi:hypothetical protein